jgi:hypothetical protein
MPIILHYTFVPVVVCCLLVSFFSPISLSYIPNPNPTTTADSATHRRGLPYSYLLIDDPRSILPDLSISAGTFLLFLTSCVSCFLFLVTEEEEILNYYIYYKNLKINCMRLP